MDIKRKDICVVLKSVSGRQSAQVTKKSSILNVFHTVSEAEKRGAQTLIWK